MKNKNIFFTRDFSELGNKQEDWLENLRYRSGIYNSFEEYNAEHGNHDMFPFMLDGHKTLSIHDCPKTDLYTLIYGNEASGLPAMYQEVGQSIFIPQTKDVDSLNLPISVGIGCFMFTSTNPQK